MNILQRHSGPEENHTFEGGSPVFSREKCTFLNGPFLSIRHFPLFSMESVHSGVPFLATLKFSLGKSAHCLSFLSLSFTFFHFFIFFHFVSFSFIFLSFSFIVFPLFFFFSFFLFFFFSYKCSKSFFFGLDCLTISNHSTDVKIKNIFWGLLGRTSLGPFFSLVYFFIIFHFRLLFQFLSMLFFFLLCFSFFHFYSFIFLLFSFKN